MSDDIVTPGPDGIIPAGVKYPDVTVKLTGTDSNAFAVIGRVSGAIQKRHGADAASNFIGLATGCGSYEELLSFIMETVHVR